MTKRKRYPEKEKAYAKKNLPKRRKYASEGYKKAKGNPEELKKILFWGARSRAKVKGLEFSIQIEDIIIPEYCPYLDIKLDSSNRVTCPSLDRVDNSKGYVKGNIQIISGKANRIKSNLLLPELVTFANGVLKNHG